MKSRQQDLASTSNSSAAKSPRSSGRSGSGGNNTNNNEVSTKATTPSEATKALFLEKVRQSNAACQAGDFDRAVRLYSEAIALDAANHILYSNRSAAFIKMGQFTKALQDAVRAKELSPEWPKAYYRQGVALQCLGRHAEALGAFSSGLAQDPKSQQLLSGLIEAAMKSPLKASLEPTYRQLQSMKLDRSPFVIISVVGQELLAQGKFASAVDVLESALKIGTCSLKLRGSVFSALSSAYWALNNLDKAISYMQQDLVVAKQLSDVSGECRAHGNLGSAFFSKGAHKEALTSHRYQLVLAMKCKDTGAASAALTSLGHVYAATGDYSNALASHKQCVDLLRQNSSSSGDPGKIQQQEAREVGNVGSVYLAMGEFDRAVECHMESLKIAAAADDKTEEARAYSNLGSAFHYKRNYEQAVVYHNHVLRLARELEDKSVEGRAYAGLGHAARCMGDSAQAKVWHEKQLDMALATRDKVAEGRACSNLGIVYQLFGDHDAALKLHQAHLNIARNLHDRAGMGRAFGNIGNAYSASGYYEQAVKYHKQELTISKEVNDRASEASTHGNLAVAYQALGMHEMALVHYHSHLNVARELKDSSGEALALCNLGSCHSSRGEFGQAVPFFENYLMLSQELGDVEGEVRACHFLGYAHYCLGNYREAVRYYDQDLALARDQQDRMNMGRAYCNLGLAHMAIGNYESALECQKYFLAIAQVMKHNQAKFRAMGNMGDVLTKMGQHEEALAVFTKQLSLAKQVRDRGFEASAYGSLGVCHRHAKQFDKALGFHTQELSILQDIGDMRGECVAHGHLGAVHLSLGNFIHATKCYSEQLERARDLKDAALEAQAHGNLGLTKVSLGRHEEAIACFEQQLAAMEQDTTTTSAKKPMTSDETTMEKGRAYGNLGACYDALGDYEEAVKWLEKYLAVSLSQREVRDQDRAYRELGIAYKNLGSLQQALVCFEKRLVVAHDLVSPDAKGSAYGELGEIHSTLGNFEQALSCMDQQLSAAREVGDKAAEARAASGLGAVHQRMSGWSSALRFHQLDLQISTENGDKSGQARALANLGETYEGMGKTDRARELYEDFLQAAVTVNDAALKTRAYASLGRIQHSSGDLASAVSYLQRGLSVAEQTGKREDEARLRHRLGMAQWESEDYESAQIQLDVASSLFESVRRETRGTADHRLELFDLQTECFHVLQRVLVLLGRHGEALVVAERARTRALVDLLLERSRSGGNGGAAAAKVVARLDESTPSSVGQIVALVNRQKASVLYYSMAAGQLFVWLIVPTKGVVRFHQAPTDGLEEAITSVREVLGVAGDGGINNNEQQHNTEEDQWSSSHLDALGDKLNSEGDRSGFLRMVNRGSRLNASSYSLSSLFSVGSVGGGSTVSSRHNNSTRSRKHSNHRNSSWQGPTAIKRLYEMLLEPLEDDLPEGYPREVMLILEGDLYLVPFAMLKGPHCTETLCERFSLFNSPSLTSTKVTRISGGAGRKMMNEQQIDENKNAFALVVGNPRLPASVSEQWSWPDLPYAAQEASMVEEILQTKAVLGDAATKEVVLAQIASAEVIHLACHISWKLSAIVLSPGEFVDAKTAASANAGGGIPTSSSGIRRYSVSDTIHEEEDTRSEATSASTVDAPSLSEFLLTAADILNLKLNAKLVVLSCGGHAGAAASSDGLTALTRALLAAGAQCVLVSLWPVPTVASRVVMKALYSALLQGARVSRALADAMTTTQNTQQLQHPANWAGYILVGADIKLSNKVALLGQALRDMLSTPDICRDALRVTLHLVEKSLQRINRGHKNAMYTSQKSIENKVGSVQGWKDLLISVGFRFEPAANGIPPSVFFPQSDPGERLTQASASLQAILGLGQTSWRALAAILSGAESADADEIIALFRHIGACDHRDDDENYDDEDKLLNNEVSVSVKVWRIPGCHELLASLGFDLMGVGKEEVTLRRQPQLQQQQQPKRRRQIQFALQALLALFETHDAPRCIDVEEDETSSSMEEEVDDEEDEEDSDDMEGNADEPFPAPRKSALVLDGGHSSAFTSYVRNRGEPDGRQSGNNDSPPLSAFVPPPPMPLYHHSKGHESDCNFTPSPVDPQKHSRGMYGSPLQHSHAGPYTYGGGGRRSLTAAYQQSPMLGSNSDKGLVGESSSSASSVTAGWDSPRGGGVRKPNLHPLMQSKLDQALSEMNDVTGNSGKRPPFSFLGHHHHLQAPLYENSDMAYSARQPPGRPVVPIRSVFTDIGYQTGQKLTDRSDPNDKFSVRAEAGGSRSSTKQRTLMEQQRSSMVMTTASGASTSADARLNPGVTKRVPPTGESDNSPENTLNTSTATAAVSKRSSISGGPSADTASITTTSSANTFIVKSDDGGVDISKTIAPPLPGVDLGEIDLQQDDHRNSLAKATPPARKLLTREGGAGKQQPQIIPEAYHDQQRSVGLGLAPPLSSIIMSSNLQVVQVDHHSDSEGSAKSSIQRSNSSVNATLSPTVAHNVESLNNFDNLSVIEAAHLKKAPPPPRRRPPVPPKPPASLEWTPPPAPSNLRSTTSAATNGLTTRDEGDGRSMTDSQYSGYSPNGQPPKSGVMNGDATKHGAGKSYMKMQDYINQQDIITVVEEASEEKLQQQDNVRDRVKRLEQQVTGFNSANTKHPQHIWSRDKRGGLHYTGLFSSDC